MPSSTVAAMLNRPTVTKRAGSGSGRAGQSVRPRFHSASVKPLPSRTAASAKSGRPLSIVPASRRKPSSSAASPPSRQSSVGSGSVSL